MIVAAWIVAGLVLLAVELHNLAFYALFVGLGCFAGAAVAAVAPDAIVAQVAAAGLVSVAGMAVVRPRVRAAMSSPHDRPGGRGVHGGFVGHEVMTVDVVGGIGRTGHVELAGERWRALSGGDVALPAGTRVVITGVEGTTLIVWPVDGQFPVELLHDGDDDGEQEQST
jgi:membrane protein implicated in regulation of membrane protease activity